MQRIMKMDSLAANDRDFFNLMNQTLSHFNKVLMLIVLNGFSPCPANFILIPNNCYNIHILQQDIIII